jgi:hypothetical protein
MRWTLLGKRHVSHISPLFAMLSEDDPRPAREQLDSHYKHGGGWVPFEGFRLGSDNSLLYPGDPPIRPVARARLRDEVILVYLHDWVAIKQPNGSFEVCRMD